MAVTKAKKKTTTKKAATKRAPSTTVKKSAASKSAPSTKSQAASTSQKTTATASKKASTKKTATKKAVTKKATTKKTIAGVAKKKTTTTKATAKKTTTKKPPQKTSTSTSSDMATPSATKSTRKKTTTGKTSVKKTTKTQESAQTKAAESASTTATKKKAAVKKAATRKTTATQRKKQTAKSSDKTESAEKKAIDPLVTDGATTTLKRKKMNVGQKPRGQASEPIILPTALRELTDDPAAVAEEKILPTPEAKQAKLDFKVNDFVVYPAHGVGRIVMIEKQVIAGITNELFVIDFDQEKMKLRVPTAKASSVGMRGLSDDKTIDKAIELLKGRARIKRTMWSRRAQEYEAKINSGDITSVAEVVRDLYRGSDQPEQSYSERQLFEAALDRLAREVAAVRKSDLPSAVNELEQSLLQKPAAA